MCTVGGKSWTIEQQRTFGWFLSAIKLQNFLDQPEATELLETSRLFNSTETRFYVTIPIIPDLKEEKKRKEKLRYRQKKKGNERTMGDSKVGRLRINKPLDHVVVLILWWMMCHYVRS